MSGKLLLDTNAVIAIFANDATTLAQIASAEECFLPVAVVGELVYGALRSRNASGNLERVEGFCRSLTVLSSGPETAKQYGNIKNGLRILGKPIPENDLWIAATALEHDLPLLTNDTHFDVIPHLVIASW